MKTTTQKDNTVKRKVGRPRKIAAMDQVDGKVRGTDTRSPRSLDELLGVAKKSPFPTQSKEEYVASLREMNLSDLQRHAEQVGVRIGYDRAELLDSLIKAFCNYSGIQQAMVKRVSAKNDVTVLSEEARKILSEGA